MKKIIAILILIFTVVTLFSGCSADLKGDNQVDDSNEDNQNDNVAGINSDNKDSGSSSIPQPPALPED